MLVLSYFILPTVALNILLTSTNSWVSKNVRHLQAELESQYHNVVLVAPLYEDGTTGDVKYDGGAFGHLLPSHQQYYNNMKKVKRGAKGVILNQVQEDEGADESVVQTEMFGQDPQNLKAWYVNESAPRGLLIAMDIIIPTYYPGFEIDLVIIPNEGLSLTLSTKVVGNDESRLDEMAKICMIKNHPVISVSTEDEETIYFQELKGRNNISKTNTKFVNSKIIQLIDTLSRSAGSGRVLPEQTSLNVNFPSMNYENSQCHISRSKPELNPDFQQIEFDQSEEASGAVYFPLYTLTSSGDLILEGEYRVNTKSAIEKRQYRTDADGTYVDIESDYYKHKKMYYNKKRSGHPYQDYSDNEDIKTMRNDMERNTLDACGITVVVNNLNSKGLGRDYFSII